MNCIKQKEHLFYCRKCDILESVDKKKWIDSMDKMDNRGHSSLYRKSGRVPKFKSKHRSRNSYTTNVVNGNISIENGRIKLPKLTAIRIKQHREIPAEYKLKSVTVSREPSGKYYVSLLYEYADCENQTESICQTEAQNILGIDYAMEGMAVLSDGTRCIYPSYYRKMEGKLTREQRKLSKCEKGSRNYQKQRKKVALCHERIRNQRKDFQHKLSRRLAEEYEAIAVEDLNMKAMSQCLNLGKALWTTATVSL